MEKKRVNEGGCYWYIKCLSDIDIDCITDDYDESDDRYFKAGNYFHTKEEAEAMAAKLRAVLNGADVIEMPNKDTVCEERENQLSDTVGEFDRWTEDAYRDGFEDCFSWLKSKIVK